MDKKWWTLVAVVMSTCMLLLDTTIVNTALPTIQRDFHSSLANVQWVIDAYALVLAAFVLVGGSLADRFGRRLLFTIGNTIFVAGSLLCGLATSALFLNLSRGVQGVGGAIMLATSLALLGGTYRGKDQGVAFGVYGAVTGLSIAVGPLAGGLITTYISWRWVFLINVPIGIVTIIIGLTKVAESRNPVAARLDLAGFVTFAAGLGALVYGLIDSAAGWTQARVEISLILAGVLLVAFLVIEFTQKRPMLDLSLFRKPTFVGGLIAAFSVAGAMFAVITYIVLYLQNLLGYSAIGGGLRTASITLALLVSATIAGRLTGRVPAKLMIGTGFVLIGAGLLLMRGVTATSAWTHLVPGMIVSGIGIGLVFVPMASTAVGVVEPARGGMASGINSTFRQVGLATGVAVYGSLFASRLRNGVTGALLHAGYGSRAGQIAAGIKPGARTGAVAPAVSAAVRVGFTDALNELLLVGGIAALLAAVASFALIRARDFIVFAPPQAAAGQAAARQAAAPQAGGPQAAAPAPVRAAATGHADK
jgi:EmrB/QacA subfamily drug resistance transporter